MGKPGPAWTQHGHCHAVLPDHLDPGTAYQPGFWVGDGSDRPHVAVTPPRVSRGSISGTLVSQIPRKPGLTMTITASAVLRERTAGAMFSMAGA